MDGLKLEKWKSEFMERAKEMEAEFDALLLPMAFNETYELRMAGDSGMFTLWMDHDALPKHLRERLSALLLETEPEDSV